MPLKLKHVGKNPAQLLLEAVFRCGIWGKQQTLIRLRKDFFVYLSIFIQWDMVDRNITCGNHIQRKTGLEFFRHLGGIQFPSGSMVRTQISASAPLPGPHGCKVRSEHFLHCVLDFGWFDPVSVDLYHIIDPAQDRIIPIFIHGHVIAALKPGHAIHMNKVCLFFIMQVAPEIRQPDAHQTFPGILLAILIEQDNLRIPVRPADGCIPVGLVHLKQKWEVGAFRRPVGIPHRKAIDKKIGCDLPRNVQELKIQSSCVFKSLYQRRRHAGTVDIMFIKIVQKP